MLWEGPLACPEAIKPTVSLDVSNTWLCTGFLVISMQIRHLERVKVPQISAPSLLCVPGNEPLQ